MLPTASGACRSKEAVRRAKAPASMHICATYGSITVQVVLTLQSNVDGAWLGAEFSSCTVSKVQHAAK